MQGNIIFQDQYITSMVKSPVLYKARYMMYGVNFKETSKVIITLINPFPFDPTGRSA